jgi:hypothetical protein
MKKHNIIYILVILLLPFVFGLDIGVVNKETTVWCGITSGGVPFSVSYANITILSPNNNIYINNENMTFIDTGLYNYEFIPNTTGNYLAICNFYNTTGFVAQARETVHIKGNIGNMEIAILIGLLSIGVFLIYLSRDIIKKPQGDVSGSVFKVFDVKNIAVFLHLAATWVLVGIVGFINILAQSQSYEPLIQGIFIAVVWGVGAFNVLYLSIYIIYLIKIRLQGVAR